MKHITLFSFFIACTLATPSFASETFPESSFEMESSWDMSTDDHEGIDADVNATSIAINGSQVHITNAAEQYLEIYNLTGVRVANIKIDSDDKTLSLNLPKGCYILKVGKIVRKISIR